MRGLSYKNIEELEFKPAFNLILKGQLEIQFDENNTTITGIDITAKNLNQLIHKLLNETTKVSLTKLHEVLQFFVEKRGETH